MAQKMLFNCFFSVAIDRSRFKGGSTLHVHFQLNAHALLCHKISQLLQLNDGPSHSVITKFCEGQAQSFLPFVCSNFSSG